MTVVDQVDLVYLVDLVDGNNSVGLVNWLTQSFGQLCGFVALVKFDDLADLVDEVDLVDFDDLLDLVDESSLLSWLIWLLIW